MIYESMKWVGKLLVLVTVPLASGGHAQQVALRWSVPSPPNPSGIFSAIAADAGDVDGDGVPDVVVGEPLSGMSVPATGVHQGRATVRSGRDGSVIHQWIGGPGAGFGFSVDGVGDLNGDGFGDVIVGSSGSPTVGVLSGRATVFSGFDGSIVYSLQTPNQNPLFNTYGTVVAGVGDVNADGVPDFAVGDPSAGPGALIAGEVYVYSGISGGLLFSTPGPQPGLRFGADVDGAGDVNGDGFDDVIVGNHLATSGSSLMPGRVQVLSGFDGSVLHDFVASQAGVPFGSEVAGIGDLNQDGFDDVMFLSPTFQFGGVMQTPFVEVHSGFDGSLLSSMTPFSVGFTLDGGQDVNGDGVNDIIVDHLVYSGAGGALLHQFVGGRLHFAGDVDGDGFAEIIRSFISFSVPTGAVALHSLGGAVPYGLGAGGANVLNLAFQPGVGPSGPATGLGSVTGAAPAAQGAAVLALSPFQGLLFGVTFLVSTSPGTFITIPVTYSAQGSFLFSLDLRQPLLAGQTFHLQFFEANAAAPQGLFGSNGLALLFVP